jgi:hypothetical protein
LLATANAKNSQVFELLNRLSLPGFSRDNWKSTIRNEVSVCDSYRDLEPWYGAETADIVYEDSQTVLTRLLISKGYLPSSWSDQHPTYYIEVKTTVGPCDMDFYMSGKQYRRVSVNDISNGEI